MCLIIIALLTIAVVTSGQEWSYNDESKWPGVCTIGRRQSPINIVSKNAIVDIEGFHIKGPLFFRGYRNVKATAQNTGHTLEWTAVEDQPYSTVSGGPLRGSYKFTQFHLHWLSEHAIDDLKYPMEIHLVHRKIGLTEDEALQRPDGLLVIGIPCQVYSDEDSKYALRELAPALPKLVNKKSKIPASFIDITRLFSSDMQSFYTYFGSLTTPQCQEVVTWIFMDIPIRISDTQFKLISKVDVGGINNFRSLQAVNNRLILRSKPSCASLVSSSNIGVLTDLLNRTSIVPNTFKGRGFCSAANINNNFWTDRIENCLNNYQRMENTE